jgi:hypothetical protein
MAIPVILQGDTSATISLRLADGYDYAGCWLDVEVFGKKITMELPSAGSVIDVKFTAGETEKVALGTHRVFFTVRNAAGDKKSLPWAKIKVTDAPAEIASPAISIDPATLGDIDMTDADSLGDMKRKHNSLLALLRGGALALAVAFFTAYGAELTPATKFNDIPGTTTLSNLVAAAGVTTSGTDGKAVTNIAENVIRRDVLPRLDEKRDKTDLTFGADKIVLKSEIPTEAKFKEMAGAALGRTYDAVLGITWRKEARGGAFFEVCETNINTAVVK